MSSLVTLMVFLAILATFASAALIAWEFADWLTLRRNT